MADLRIANPLQGVAGSVGTAGTGQVKPAGGFGELLKEALQNTVEASRQAEAESAKAVAGKADITSVVTAVSNAEMALDTVVAVRDRVITAYQEILRMPI
ncbi:MAG TPA: flagellar hook-basal body complex protein FliE [Ferrovibrio sp.]|uniref:flagellar hook-basal body complex protein FliE n=1 Tax=Ferrovibrio sp. TaxID=1917215 RepID=UPI002ED5B608